MPKRDPDQKQKKCGPIDQHIAITIRKARKAAGLSQTDLGAPLGVSFQQIQKYEDGRNRIAASRLFIICKTLKIDMMSIFESLPKELR